MTTFFGPPASSEDGIGTLTLSLMLEETAKRFGQREALVFHEHGEEKLDAVPLGGRHQVGRGRHWSGAVSLHCDRHADPLRCRLSPLPNLSVNDVALWETHDG